MNLSRTYKTIGDANLSTTLKEFIHLWSILFDSSHGTHEKRACAQSLLALIVRTTVKEARRLVMWAIPNILEDRFDFLPFMLIALGVCLIR